MLLAGLLGTKPSVGGPMTMMVILFLAILAVGVHEASSKKRGALGWIVSIAVSLIGGCSAVFLNGAAMDMILPLIQFQGRLIDHPVLLFVFSTSAAILALSGSWIALNAVSRFR